MRLRRAAIVVSIALGACSLQPAYRQPDLPVASAYPTGPAYKATPGGKGATPLPAAEIGWRDFLTDPRLQKLVEVALANNRDLRISVLNVAQAQSSYRIQRAALFPQVTGFADATRSRTPGSLTTNGQPQTLNTWEAGVAVPAWELDFFGRLRSLSDAQFQLYLANAQARKAAEILLVSEVANQYLTMLADDELLAVTERLLETSRKNYDIVKLQFDTGTTTELALRQAETIVEQAEANHAAYVRARAQDENMLVLLLGQPMPQDLPPVIPMRQQAILADIPPGLPSDLLTRRPDIQEAEAILRSENANIGAARAAFFPQITLTGSFGVASASLNGLSKGGAQAWSFGPSITVPIFEGGQLRASLDLARIQKDIGVAQYEKAIQTAFSEVANDLAARGTYDDQIASLERYVTALQRSVDLSWARYRSGVDNYLSVLTAQTNLYSGQQTLVAVRLNRLTNLVTLYKDLGGGWIQHTGDEPRAPDAGTLYSGDAPERAAAKQATAASSPSSPKGTPAKQQ
ncbi:MAG TPA: efflux transporter outer membrane subunit [Burkholderiales bacterium]|nr:efflux transporter outer membrane subunit [Burkholderiales bacterium]